MKLRVNDFEIEESGIIRAILALSALGVASYGLLNGVASPEWLIALMGGIIYYYFETKPKTEMAETIDGDISFRVRK